jgi:hypothetical protein
MSNEDMLEFVIRGIVIEICEVMYRHGINPVPLAPIMRLLEVPEDQAKKYDGVVFELDDEFIELAKKHRSIQNTLMSMPSDSTIH